TPVILGDGQICPSSICSLINWNGENITFSVTHFSTYSVAATSGLVINDQGGSIYTYNNTYFYANYTNFTSSSINDNTDAGQCNISFNATPSTVYQMTYNSSSGLYEYNKTFTYSQAGSVGWTVSCDSNYEPRTLTAATNVLSSGNFAPTVSITAPPNASVFEQRDQINFTGTGSDREDILTLTWYSSIDGYFGTGANVNKSDLSVGNHTIMLNTTDSGGLTANDTIIITINAIPDQDGDGLRDSQDAVVGNTSNISITGVSQINVYINGSSNIDGQIFSGKLPVLINDNGNALCNFTYNFSQSSLNFSRLSIKKDWYYTICLLGGQLQSGNGKTIFLTDNGFTGLCVKDAADINVSNISDACNATDEHDFTSCLGNSTGVAVNGFTCVDHGSTIEINNLTHSGVKGTGGSAPSSGSSSSTSSGTGSGGGGGGGGSAAALYGVPGNVEIDNPCWAQETTFTVYSKAGQLASMMDIQFAKPFTNELIVSGKTDKQGKFTYTFEEKGLYNMIVGRAMPLKLQIRIIDCTQPEPVKAAAKEAADNKTEVTEPQEYAVEDVIEQQAKEDEQKKPRRLPKNRIYILGTLFLIPGAIIGYFVYTTNKKKHKHKKKKNHMKNAFRNIYKL
ncbi:hypothetical protein KY325_04275, partial [Candidatus Woesearchaeota archaeon]|nr:hypothetical protein [Candidatus Woesearchaeota archaeon]